MIQRFHDPLKRRLNSDEGSFIDPVVEGDLPTALALEDGASRAPVVFGAHKDQLLSAFLTYEDEAFFGIPHANSLLLFAVKRT